jgi:hypothetical protein
MYIYIYIYCVIWWLWIVAVYYIEGVLPFFIFCWPCISLQILTNDQLDTLFHVFIYLISLHVSSITVLIIWRSNCIIHHLVWLVCVSDCLVCRSEGKSLLTGIPSSHLHRLIIRDDVLYNSISWWWALWCLKHVERWEKYIHEKVCQVGY